MTAFTAAPDGVQIAYDTQGTGQTALVFVHGWSCNRGYWSEQIAHFSPHYQTVAIDLGGHGASGDNRTNWTVEAFGADVAAVVEHLGLRRVILIGHSMGGPVIMAAARLIPDRLLGLVGADTYRDVSQTRVSQVLTATVAALQQDFRPAAERFVRNFFLPTSDPALVQCTVDGMASARPAVAIGAMTNMSTYGPALQEGLRTLGRPVTAINSDYRPNNFEAAKEHGIDMRIMSGVGHFVMNEDPTTFNRLLSETIRQMECAAQP